MRKLLAALVLLGMMVSPVFAGEIMEATGTVDSINPIDPPRGDYEGGIMLSDTASSVTRFTVDTATVISDHTGGRIDSADIHDGDKVKITYTVSDMGPIAVTILRLPAAAAAK